MASEVPLDDLYREVILDHYRKPRNRGALDAPDVTVEGMNPLCGDEVCLQLRLAPDGAIDEIAFEGRGCSISQASTSILTEDVKGASIADARQLIAGVRAMLTAGGEPPHDRTGDIEAFQGVAQFPARVKCAMLSWNALEQALDEGAALRDKRGA